MTKTTLAPHVEGSGEDLLEFQEVEPAAGHAPPAGDGLEAHQEIDRLSPRHTPVLVIGPGAIGSLLAARLVHHGFPVTVACRTEATALEIRRDGVRATDTDGRTRTGTVPPVVGAQTLDVSPRIVLLTTKCQDAPGALRDWLPHLDDDVPIVALQNGLMGDELAPLVPERYVETMVHFPATLHNAGDAEQTGPGGIDIGVWDTPAGPSASEAAMQAAEQLLGHAVDVQRNPDIRGAKWTKLVINSCITTLGVVTGKTLGEILEDRRVRDLFLQISTEGHRAGLADGVEFQTVQGFHPARFALPERGGRLRRIVLHIVLRLIGRRYRRHRSSSLQGLERGRRTEVDHLNGHIVETAHRHGLDAPVNRAVVDLVHGIERRQEVPGPGHLRDLLHAAPSR